VVHGPATRRRGGTPFVTQEERLIDLIRQAEGSAYALAHSYDIARQPDRAYALVALGERLRETAADVSSLVRHVEPHDPEAAIGLVSRAFCLRRLLRGIAWEGPHAAPDGEQRFGAAPSSKIATKDVLALLTPADHLA
jgi:hypothetical protein